MTKDNGGGLRPTPAEKSIQRYSRLISSSFASGKLINQMGWTYQRGLNISARAIHFTSLNGLELISISIGGTNQRPSLWIVIHLGQIMRKQWKCREEGIKQHLWKTKLWDLCEPARRDAVRIEKWRFRRPAIPRAAGNHIFKAYACAPSMTGCVWENPYISRFYELEGKLVGSLHSKVV